SMPQRNWNERQQHGALAAAVQAEGDREQPAHRWVEAVKKTEARERQPRPQLSRGCAHAGACRADRTIRRLVASRIAIGIRRTVASLQPNLMRPMAFQPVDEEFRVEYDPSRGVGVELHHPA